MVMLLLLVDSFLVGGSGDGEMGVMVLLDVQVAAIERRRKSGA